MKSKRINKLFESELIRNSSVLLSGNVLGQAVSLLIYPILTYLYSAEEIGVFATFASTAGLLTTIGTARYEESLVIAKDKRETTQLLGLSSYWLFIFSLLLLASGFIYPEKTLSFFRLEALLPYVHYLPLTVFFTGIVYLLSNLATREKQFKSIAISGLVQNITNSGFRLIFAALSMTRIGFIMANWLSQAAGILPFRKLGTYYNQALKCNWKEALSVGRKYKDFPLYNTGRTFLSSFSLNLPFLFLIGVFGDARIGLYSLAFTYLHRPINLVANSLFSTLFENISSQIREKQSVLPKMLRYWKQVFCWLLPCFVLAFLLAPPVFSIFEKSFAESARYFQYLLPWMFLLLLASPLYFVPIVFGKQRAALWIEIFILAVRWGGLFIGVYMKSFDLAILLFSLSGALFCLIQLVWFYFLLKKYETKRMNE